MRQTLRKHRALSLSLPALILETSLGFILTMIATPLATPLATPEWDASAVAPDRPATCTADVTMPIQVEIETTSAIVPGEIATARIRLSSLVPVDLVELQLTAKPGVDLLQPDTESIGRILPGEEVVREVSVRVPSSGNRRTVEAKMIAWADGYPIERSSTWNLAVEAEPSRIVNGRTGNPVREFPASPVSDGTRDSRNRDGGVPSRGNETRGGTSSLTALINITGTFAYEDRLYDGGGYTGTTQDLAIRHADIDIVNAASGSVIATGRTDANGAYSVSVNLLVPTNLYVRCLSSTEEHPDYQIWVVDNFIRMGGTTNISGSTIHSITTTPHVVDPGNGASGSFGAFRTADATGFGVAQAFNILDNGIDVFDYLHSPASLGRYPTDQEFVVYGWNFQSGSSGSNYQWQGIYLTARPNDTDGWSDTVILHETGHWASDLFGDDDNPGGMHVIGDNDQDPRLSYGEGYATYFSALVREFRAPRLNGLGQMIDSNVSMYADLSVPPPLPDPGGLEFAYDFETGIYSTGVPMQQIGMANETNVTSAMWDLVDGTSTRDLSPGADDDPVDENGAFSWEVTEEYMPSTLPGNWLTIEDFHDGWFDRHGSGFLRTDLDEIFVNLAGMPLNVDAFEPDDTPALATPVVPLTYTAGPGGKVVINEVALGADDQIELYNAGNTAVDLTGWQIKADRNSLPTATYIFPPFLLYPGAHVVVHKGGDADDNGPVHLFDEFFIVFWINGDDGACTLLNASGVAQDFLRWDNVNGSDPSNRPVPPGLSWSGTLLSAPDFKTLGRNANGTDTDVAADFTVQGPTFGAPNFAVVPRYHIYNPNRSIADADVIRLDLTGGDYVTVLARAPHSDGEPILELLSEAGEPTSPTRSTYGIPWLAEVSFLASTDTTIYARITNGSPFTEYAPIDLVAYLRPSASVLRAPAAFIADPANASNTNDAIQLAWLNGGDYDSLQVLRNGVLRASLSGGESSYGDIANRGLYTYEVRGFLGGLGSLPTPAKTFAGILSCNFVENFESGTSNLIRQGNWGLTTLLASQGTFSLTDSPTTTYFNNQDVSTELVTPGELLLYPTLQFDHICITEADFDFGMVEISTDFGTTWTTLASYSMGDHPQWADGSPDPADWVHEVIDLEAYLGKKVRIRFRLVSDGLVVDDGWFLDDVRLSQPGCDDVTAAPEPVVARTFSASPNPFGASVTFQLPAMPGPGPTSLSIFDIGGRLVRRLDTGATHEALTWDGRDRDGRAVPAGVYLARVGQGSAAQEARLVRMR